MPGRNFEWTDEAAQDVENIIQVKWTCEDPIRSWWKEEILLVRTKSDRRLNLQFNGGLTFPFTVLGRDTNNIWYFFLLVLATSRSYPFDFTHEHPAFLNSSSDRLQYRAADSAGPRLIPLALLLPDSVLTDRITPCSLVNGGRYLPKPTGKNNVENHLLYWNDYDALL